MSPGGVKRSWAPSSPCSSRAARPEWEELARPDLPLVVGLDGGYVHSSHQRTKRDGWFEVISGQSMPTDGQTKCFGFVETYDTEPTRRLFEVLRSQGMQATPQGALRT